ncbi:hypothetical protein HT031_004652 [Scenedesmus sp. PABB004]|nr:hypothetical protein HT031_004652 [Scenedesmus sp. PABB004]
MQLGGAARGVRIGHGIRRCTPRLLRQHNCTAAAPRCRGRRRAAGGGGEPGPPPAGGGGEPGPAGQQEEQQEELALELEVAVPLSSPQGSQLAYILTQGGTQRDVLFGPAVTTYLTELQQERDREAEMERAAAADAAADAAAAAESAGESAGGGGGGGADASSTWDDGELMRRIRAVREAERGQVLADVIYLAALRRLHGGGVALLGNLALLAPGIAAPPPGFVSAAALAQSGLLSGAVVDAVVSFMTSTFGGGDAAMMDAAAPPTTPLSVDRVQAARLYAGLLEFGYFSAALEAACGAAGVAVGSDSTAMIAHADGLEEGALRRMCAVRSADAWWAAVRHAGFVFGLQPNDDPFDSFGLPYPDLSLTISQIQMEPAANLLEHFNTPGTAARLAARAADASARGWSGEGPPPGSLPDADLVSFELGLFRRLLLEAAVFGAVLHGVEVELEAAHGYALSSRAEREAHRGAAPL